MQAAQVAQGAKAQEAPTREALRKIFSAIIDEGLTRPDVVEAVEAKVNDRAVEVYVKARYAYVLLSYREGAGYEAEAGPLAVVSSHFAGLYYAPVRFKFEAKGRTAREAVRALREAAKERMPRLDEAVRALMEAAYGVATELLSSALDVVNATAEALKEVKEMLSVD